MRMEIITPFSNISLGTGAKNLFLKNILTMDEDGTFDTLQTIQSNTVDKIRNLPTAYGFTNEIKNGTIKAFEKLEVGTKFLCLNTWLMSYDCLEAQYYKKLVVLCNEGQSKDEAKTLADSWLEEQKLLLSSNEKMMDVKNA